MIKAFLNLVIAFIAYLIEVFMIIMRDISTALKLNKDGKLDELDNDLNYLVTEARGIVTDTTKIVSQPYGWVPVVSLIGLVFLILKFI
jgi:hypothetical protein